MASSSLFSIFLLASIMLAFLCHTEAVGSAHTVDEARAEAMTGKSLVEGAKAIATKDKSRICIKLLDSAVYAMEVCLEKLKNPLSAGDKHDANLWASAAMTYIDNCNDELGASMPDDLKQALDKAFKQLDLFLTILSGV